MVGWVQGLTFALSGLFAGVAGVIQVSRIGIAQPDIGVEIPLTAIAAVAIRGTSILGGSGAIWRTLFGLAILALIGNGFNILGLDAFYRSMTQGAIIVIAVTVDALLRRGQ